MSEKWIAATTAQIMARVVKRREALKMTTEEFAAQCTLAGLPFTTGALRTVEQGNRRSLTVQELLVFAHVLETSPVLLLWPKDGVVELVPGVQSTAQQARQWAGVSESEAQWHQSRLDALRGAEAVLRALG